MYMLFIFVYMYKLKLSSDVIVVNHLFHQAIGFASLARAAHLKYVVRKGPNEVGTNGVTANFISFDRRTFGYSR